MARYIGSKCRLCRREGMKLFLKGTRCSGTKCAFAKRAVPPGMHTRTSSKASYYALQLREKQKAKRLYGMLERPFRRFFTLATKAKGVTGRKLLELLERRLDNVLYKSLFAFSRSQGRQFVLHGFAFVNGRRVNVASCLVKAGDEIVIKATDKAKQLMKSNVEAFSKERSCAPWLDVDIEALKIKVLRIPEKEDMILPINEQLIIELYSK